MDSAQRAASSSQPQTPAAPPPQDKRLFGLFPNYRSTPSATTYTPLTTNEKFKMAAQESFDRGAIILSLATAGVNQWNNSNPSFGQGAAGYGRYFGTGYADVVIGNMFTVGVYPSLLHQDPRYFRRGSGGGWSRLGYAMSQIFVTRGDSGKRQPNYSEFLGNGTGVLISNAYYPDNRDVGSNFSRFGFQVGLDMAGNILKEFGPDVLHRRSKHPKTGVPGQPDPAAKH